MDTFQASGRTLPHWVNEPPNWYVRARPIWLESVQSARTATFRRCVRAGLSPTKPEVGAVVNELIGLMLMGQFVRHRSCVSVKAFQDFDIAAPRTIRSVSNRFCEELSSPLLQGAFNSSTVCDDVEIPVEAIPSQDDEVAWLRDQRFPVTAFGDYHQLCLERPLLLPSEVDKVDERRSRGVHFTPSPLVDYLTESTLSRQLPRERSDTIRILDPSCGSGIFLIAAMRFLAEHARATNGENRNPMQDTLNSIASCIFGIDINSTAIEWARRSLLFAVWEMDPDSDHSGLRVPDLRRNLVAANFLAPESPAGFPGDFDAILGGPPFVRFRQMKKDCPIQVNDWRKRFTTARKGQFDLYMPFFEQAIHRLKIGGRLGWSVSSTFLRSQFGASLRELVGSSCTVTELVEFENPKVYADAVTQIVLVQLRKEKNDETCRHVSVRGKPDLRQALETVYSQPDAAHTNLEMRQLAENACRGRNWRLNACGSSIVDGGGEKRSSLGQLGVQITQGIVTGADAVFLLRLVRESESGLSWVEDREGRRHCIEASLLRPAIRSRGIRGYSQPRIQNHLLLPYDARGRLLSEGDLKADFPATYSYLSTRRNEIPRTGKRNRPFYAFRNDAVLRLESGPRIITGMVTSGSDATLDLAGSACPHAGVLVISRFPCDVDPLYLLGIMNSPVFWSFIQGTMPTMGNGRHVIRRGPLAQFSVALPERSTQLEIAGSVRQLMETTNKHEQTCIKQTIDAEAMKIYGIDATADISSAVTQA